jgi:pimeloyl-ACP methyl ester carboxylesterase
VCRGFDVSVAADVSLRLHFTESFLSEMVVDEETGTKRLRRDVYAARYRHGIQRDAARDVDGSVFWGHLAAVRGHNLTRDEAERLRNAPFQTAVIYGEEDRVVTPAASRDLARRIGAVEHAVRGAHLIVDESSHEINRHLAALWKSCAEEGRASNPLLGSHIIRSLANWASPLPDTSWAHFVKESR